MPPSASTPARDPYVVLGLHRHASDVVVEAALEGLLAVHDDPDARAVFQNEYDRIVEDRRNGDPAMGQNAGPEPAAPEEPDPEAEIEPKPAEPKPDDEVAEPDEVRSRVPIPEVIQPETDLSYKPSDPDVTMAEMVAGMRRLRGEVERDRMAQCLIDRQIGLLYLKGQGHYLGSNLSLDEWCRKNFGMPYARIAKCATFAGTWSKFLAAHAWLVQEGEALGWTVSRSRGCDYGMEVVGRHRDFMAGMLPGQREAEAAARRAQKEATKQVEQDAIAREKGAAAVRRPDDFAEQIEAFEAVRTDAWHDLGLAAAAARRERQRGRLMLRQVARLRYRLHQTEAELRTLRSG